MKLELIQPVDKGDMDEEVVLQRGGIKKKVKIRGSLRMGDQKEDKPRSIDIKKFKGVRRKGDGIRAVFEVNGREEVNGRSLKEFNLRFENRKELNTFLNTLKKLERE